MKDIIEQHRKFITTLKNKFGYEYDEMTMLIPNHERFVFKKETISEIFTININIPNNEITFWKFEKLTGNNMSELMSEMNNSVALAYQVDVELMKLVVNEVDNLKAFIDWIIAKMVI